MIWEEKIENFPWLHFHKLTQLSYLFDWHDSKTDICWLGLQYMFNLIGAEDQNV